MITFGMIGAGGMGCEMVHLVPYALKQRYPDLQDGDYRIVFAESEPNKTEYDGYPVISVEDFIAGADENTFFNIAIADPYARERLAGQLERAVLEPLALQHPTAEIRDGNDIGAASVFGFMALVTARIKIGKYFNCMPFSQVAHDCEIGDYVSFYSRVDCNGHIIIEDYVTIGNGACIRNGTREKPLRVGKGATIGMGAIVTKDVPPGATVVGNPASVVVKD